MEVRSGFVLEGPNFEGRITGDLAGSGISLVFKDPNEVVLDQIPVESQKARRLAGLDMICTDLRMSQRALQKFLALVGDTSSPKLPEDTTVLEALWTSAVVLYCKPFVDAEGRVVVLKFNQVFKGDLKVKLEDHNKLMMLRNQHLAHCGALGLQQHLVFLLKRPQQSHKSSTLQTWGVYASLPHPRWAKSSLELVDVVLDRVESIRKKAEQGLREELGLGDQTDLGKLILEVNVNKPLL